MVIGVRKWALIVGAGCVLGAGIGAFAGMPAAPVPPRQCHEAMAIARAGMVINCSPGEHMTTEALHADLVLVRCTCAKPAPVRP